jgi:hypothetical protein
VDRAGEALGVGFLVVEVPGVDARDVEACWLARCRLPGGVVVDCVLASDGKTVAGSTLTVARAEAATPASELATP